MLTELSVKNFALIDEIRLEFGDGLTVLSGETGAGKSILVGALSLILGGKASSVLVRTGEKEAILSALFDIQANSDLKEHLEQAGLSDGSQLILRRHISAEGKSRIYVNGASVTLSQLEAISSCLIDLSGQHDQQILLRQENHLSILDDSMVGEKEFRSLKEKYEHIYSRYIKIKEELSILRQLDSDKSKREDFLRFQIQEIEAAHIDRDTEEDELIAEKARVKNADFLNEYSQFATASLSASDGSVLEQLNAILLRLDKAIAMDERLQEVKNRLEESKIPLEEADTFFSKYGESLTYEPGRLEQIESRLYQLYQLKRKYGATLMEVKQKYEALTDELDLLEHQEETLLQKEKELKDIEQEVYRGAQALSDERKKQAKILEKSVQRELSDLSMGGAIFHVVVESPAMPAASDCGPNGFDQIRFDMTANQGEKPKPLSQIASGGELSRILLAIKKILGTRSYPITYVFDEIDTGIGGAVAEVVGRKLKEIAASNQVLCVTHLPQVASFAESHYIIEKIADQKRTQTIVRALEDRQERENEIARMLGGVQITSKTVAHAREMLKTGNLNK